MMQQGLKILYSLDEIKQNGFEIKAPIPNEEKCPYCNRIFKPKGILNPYDNTIRIFISDKECNCEKAKAEKDIINKRKMDQIEKEFIKVKNEEINKRIKYYFDTEFVTKQFKSKTFENFILNKDNAKTKLAGQKFVNQFEEMKKGIIFEGANGTGKTHISIAISNELIKMGVPVIFGTLTELVDKYKKCYKNNTDIELTRLYSIVDLLIIDDLGVEVMNDWMLSKLFTIINERERRELPIIITTNYNIEQLRQRLSIPNKVCETTNSIISRLCKMCYRVECKGKDYRIYKD